MKWTLRYVFNWRDQLAATLWFLAKTTSCSANDNPPKNQNHKKQHTKLHKCRDMTELSLRYNFCFYATNISIKVLPNEFIPNGLTDLLGKKKNAGLISCPCSLLFFEVVLSTYLAPLIKASQPAVCSMRLEVFSETRRWKGVHFNNTQKHELETLKKTLFSTDSKSQINCKDRNTAGGFVGPVKRWCFSAHEPALGLAVTAQDLKI